jgi:membrane protease YdiL (CAAX protease family)
MSIVDGPGSANKLCGSRLVIWHNDVAPKEVKDTFMAGSLADHPRMVLEPAGPDFPWHGGNPPAIAGRGWLLVMLAVVAGFAALTLPLPFTDTLLTGWLRMAAFVGLPLLGLRMASPGHWHVIFGRVGGRELRLMFGFAFTNIVVSMTVGVLIKTYGTVIGNASIADAATLEGIRLFSFFAKVAPQMLGEELLTILPFLALLAFCHDRLGFGRNASAAIAWLLSAAAFGLVHLPTYNWNFVQCLVVIGSARLVLTWAYVWTKNIWVSSGAHVINDWLLIGSSVFLAPLFPAA